uniref:WGS project CAEQ00000000 data, annotated contig 2383 n=1 Tax=Trypanosoma congolense (strain IL3000) TaxID=1068625 RepID=F9WDM8_TRYCI|nr:unnamed protein product [Trypanosoma congolense IL3000]
MKKKASLVQPATSSWCQGPVFFIGEEAKCQPRFRCYRLRSWFPAKGPRRCKLKSNRSPLVRVVLVTTLSNVMSTQPCHLTDSVPCKKHCVRSCSCVVMWNQIPGTLTTLELNVQSLTKTKLSSLLSGGSDIIIVQEAWKSAKEISSLKTYP